jgi:hypothetical protein
MPFNAGKRWSYHAVQRASKSPEVSHVSMLIADEIYSIVRVLVGCYILKSDWHAQFDANRWILLPSTAVLEDVRDFIQSVISARKEPSQAEISTFHSKVSSPSIFF